MRAETNLFGLCRMQPQMQGLNERERIVCQHGCGVENHKITKEYKYKISG